MSGPAPGAAGHGAPPPGLASAVGALLRDARGLTRDHALLAMLEIQRAGLSLVQMLALGLAAAVLAVSAWIALVCGAVILAVGSGASWPLALGVAALLNIAGAALLALWVRARVPDLFLSATLHQLRGESAGE